MVCCTHTHLFTNTTQKPQLILRVFSLLYSLFASKRISRTEKFNDCAKNRITNHTQTDTVFMGTRNRKKEVHQNTKTRRGACVERDLRARTHTSLLLLRIRTERTEKIGWNLIWKVNKIRFCTVPSLTSATPTYRTPTVQSFLFSFDWKSYCFLFSAAVVIRNCFCFLTIVQVQYSWENKSKALCKAINLNPFDETFIDFAVI